MALDGIADWWAKAAAVAALIFGGGASAGHAITRRRNPPEGPRMKPLDEEALFRRVKEEIMLQVSDSGQRLRADIAREFDTHLKGINDNIVKLREEVVERSHTLADRMHAKALFDVVELTKMQSRLETNEQRIGDIDSEYAGEVRRLEQQSKDNHADLKQELKEIRGLLVERRQGGQA